MAEEQIGGDINPFDLDQAQADINFSDLARKQNRDLEIEDLQYRMGLQEGAGGGTFPNLSSGAGAPASTPSQIGDMYIDTTANRQYVATGTGSSADWDKQAVFASGTETVTGGGADIPVTLPWDWSGGYLIVIASRSTGKWLSDTGSFAKFETSYDALTAAGYTTDEVMAYALDGTDLYSLNASSGADGQPKSATTTGFVLDAGGTTTYVKWFVTA